jgi:hypothetical protein
LREDHGFLGGPATGAAIKRRELPLINDQMIDMLMADTGSHAGKLMHAFALHEQVSGERTRRYLQDYSTSLMHEEQVGEKIAKTAGGLCEHVTVLGQLNRAALRLTMAARTAGRFAEQYEKPQADLVENSKFFRRLGQREGTVRGAALALLDLLAARAFAKGPVTQTSRRHMLVLIQQPTFMDGFLMDCLDALASKAKLRDLEQRIIASNLDRGEIGAWCPIYQPRTPSQPTTTTPDRDEGPSSRLGITRARIVS